MRLLIVPLHLTKFYDNSVWEMYSQRQMLYRCISWYQPAHSKHGKSLVKFDLRWQ